MLDRVDKNSVRLFVNRLDIHIVGVVIVNNRDLPSAGGETGLDGLIL